MLSFLTCLNHAVYVSVTEVKHTAGERWEVSCRLFNNDLEDAIRNATGQSVVLRTDGDIFKSGEMIAAYVSQKLQFFDTQGKRCTLRWVKGVAQNDSVWCSFYLDAEGFSTIENGLLTELFPTQQNVVTLEKDGQKLFFRFNSEAERQAVD